MIVHRNIILFHSQNSMQQLRFKRFYVRHSKTNAGVRAVPIADKTFSFFEYWYSKNNCYYLLSPPDGSHFQYRNYYDSYFIPIMQELNLTHKPHDTRHTCISLLASSKVYPTTIKNRWSLWHTNSY